MSTTRFAKQDGRTCMRCFHVYRTNENAREGHLLSNYRSFNPAHAVSSLLFVRAMPLIYPCSPGREIVGPMTQAGPGDWP